MADADAPTPGSDMPSVTEIEELTRRLRATAEALRARPVASVYASLGRAGSRFLDGADPLRRRALAELPGAAGFSPEMARVVLDGMARDWTGERLAALLDAELGEPGCLDGFVPGMEALRSSAGSRHQRTLMAVGPALCVQVVSGSVPGVGVDALLRSLLIKSPTLLKPGRGDALLPRLFAEALAEEDPELAASLAVVYWRGGSEELEAVAMEAAEVAVVYGSDETVSTLRALAPATTRFVGYHHRVGVGIVGREALGSRGPAQEVARDVARAAALFEQRGCVCPQLIHVEEGGRVAPDAFARLLAEALEALEQELPSPVPSAQSAAARQQLRGTAEMHAASGGVELHHGGPSSPWTVVFEAEAVGLPAGLARTIRIRPIDDAATLGRRLEPLAAHLQSVGYAGLSLRAAEVGEAVGRAGASRIVPFRALSFPPPWWLHDGRGPLRDLVRWVELE